MKILPVGAELFRVDGRTEKTKLIFALFSAILLKRLKYCYMKPTTYQELVKIFDKYPCKIRHEDSEISVPGYCCHN